MKKLIVTLVILNLGAVTCAQGEQPKLRDTSETPIVNSIGMKFVRIPAGSFMMGSHEPPEQLTRALAKYRPARVFGADREGLRSEYPLHRVQITRPFYLGIQEVTQGEYKRVMGSEPSFFKDDSLPVEGVSWKAAKEFCRRLSSLPKEKAAARVYRLPTEAEWEYACRSGTTARYSFGDDASELGEYAWWSQNSGGTTHRGGQKKPNAWGLYDMHGNLWEWCADPYAEDYYRKSPVVDPVGPEFGRCGVLRGGSWMDYRVGVFRCAYRLNNPPDVCYHFAGFRVAVVVL